ncbi:MotA/TolQ/ExbB proton channel family protein [Haloferula sp. A504]|uniref:MotA/TolQ/ExbB proton channel family protein n=1 Tax=Haloferula sp. A504 TaxID=3373601 RepID=UPI0031BFB1F8|nr:MotA/TolQ/ExbB proton channel family protein [Verrucomicrobiaceae bacterium E54]
MNSPVTSILAAASPGLIEQIGLFFREGGVFMGMLGATSVVAVAAILFKFLTLSRGRILPADLARDVESFESLIRNKQVAPVLERFEEGESTLARLCAETVRQRGKPQSEIAEPVQALARAEIVRLHSGMTAIDVVISVAPLLGLLGTASGLVVVFSGLESDADWLMITAGIGRALKTTIVGMAIAVPAIIAQGFFQRKIETYAARLEVLLTSLAHLCERSPRLGEVEPAKTD